MRSRRTPTFLLAAVIVLAGAMPAVAAPDPVQEKRVKLSGGRVGSAARFAERDGKEVRNSVTLSATDADGRGGQCTETWVDYATKPHQHFNPGVLVNCSGGTRRVSGAVDNRYEGVRGMALVVCSVPDTEGKIRRDRSNCRGSLSAIYLHSGQRYKQFRVNADQYPSGVQVWKR